MILVRSKHIALYDINGEPDAKYKTLIVKEMICIRKCREEITKMLLYCIIKRLSNIKI